MQEIIHLLNSDERIIRLRKIKTVLLNDSDLIDKITRLKKLDKYSNEYKILKMELYNNKIFIEFKELENEINFLIMEINNKLKVLTDDKGCL